MQFESLVQVAAQTTIGYKHVILVVMRLVIRSAMTCHCVNELVAAIAIVRSNTSIHSHGQEIEI